MRRREDQAIAPDISHHLIGFIIIDIVDLIGRERFGNIISQFGFGKFIRAPKRASGYDVKKYIAPADSDKRTRLDIVQRKGFLKIVFIAMKGCKQFFRRNGDG